MQSQCQKTDHFDPVVTFVQMGTLMLENVLPGLAVHAHGNVNPGFDESKDKSGIDLIALPAAPDSDCLPYLSLQFPIGKQTVNAEAKCYDAPYPGEQCRKIPTGESKFRLQAQITADLNGHQQANARQQP